LRRIEERFAAALEKIETRVQQGLQLCRNFRFAGFAAVQHGAAIVGGLILPRRETAIASPRLFRAFRVVLIEISQHRCHRAAETVDVQAAEFDAAVWCVPLVVRAQPEHEIVHLHIAPHPGGEPRERLLL